MSDINSTQLSGKVIDDAILEESAKGLVICKFSIANFYDRPSEDGWLREVNFFNLAIFGKTAKSLQPYLKKGQLVGIDAELRQKRWEQDGKNKSSNDLIVKRVHLLSSYTPDNSPEDLPIMEIDEDENDE